MSFNLLIYILYYQSNLRNYFQPNPASCPYKMEYCILTEVLEQPGSDTPVLNVVTIRKLRHANVDKQSKLLADVEVILFRGAV